jgi:thiol-disulfide isomerase/thioredoxin
MIFLHIDSTSKNSSLLNKYIEEGKDVFVLVYLEGCGPCNATRPEWKKIKNVLEKKYKNNNDIVVSDVDQEVLDEIKGIKIKPVGFPTMFYMCKKKDIHENYEDCSHIKVKDRSVDSFVNWIESKIKNQDLQKGGSKKTLKRRKWSLKYKKSINCRRPKGFSQKQYCKYTRKKGKK